MPTIKFPYRQILLDSPSFDPYLIEMAESHVQRSCPEGYLHVEHEGFADWLLVCESHAYMAVRFKDDDFYRLDLVDFFRELIDTPSLRFRLCSTHPGMFTLMAVGFQNRPTLRAPTRLVPAQTVLAELQSGGKDAGLIIATPRERSVAFCHAGELLTVHFADPSHKSDSSVHDQILSYCTTAGDNTTLEVFHNLAIHRDLDGGRPFSNYLTGEIGPPPFLLTVRHGEDILVRRLFRDGQVTIGRGMGNDVILDHRSVSRRHCEIRWNGSTFQARDLGSANGTALNGNAIQTAPIQIGDLLAVGDFAVRFGDEPQRIEVSDLRTLFLEGHQPTQQAQLVYRNGVIHIDRPVFSIGRSVHASLRVKGLFMRPVQATIVKNRDGPSKLMAAGGGCRVTLRGEVVGKHGMLLRSGDEFSVGRHRFVFMLTTPQVKL
ncbi:FHA domain-containing protein [Myxococcota bacterium]